MTRPTWPAVRAAVLFFTGVFGIAYELVFVHPPDQTVLLFLGGLITSSAVLNRDEKKGAHDDHDAADGDKHG